MEKKKNMFRIFISYAKNCTVGMSSILFNYGAEVDIDSQLIDFFDIH